MKGLVSIGSAEWIKIFLIVSIIPIFLPIGCALHQGQRQNCLSGDIYIAPDAFDFLFKRDRRPEIEKLFSTFDPQAPHGTISITHPYDGSVFPADIAAPPFSWQDTKSCRWLLIFSARQTDERIFVLTSRPCWTPEKDLWDTIKSEWMEDPAQATVLGIGRDGRILTQEKIRFKISCDPVAAPVVYQEIPLPFAHAFKNTHRFKWRLGDIAAYEKPKAIFKSPPSCMFCHAFSGDGKTWGMDMDYKNDKGGYILAKAEPRVEISPENIISWNDLKLDKTLPNMGLFSKISHDGKFVVSTVNEKPFMITMDHIDFSQLFFPLTGRLAVYSKKERRFSLLKGADNPDFVQTSPEWSPDGKHVIFARARVDERLRTIMGKKRLLLSNSKKHICELNKRYRIRYDLFSVPFNNGRGGKPVPLEGASFNGSSNYFPRVSPDGKWIVFNQSDTGIVAQPASTLYIIPFHGGRARKMNCNTTYYNSWHSWSPNSRWLVFTSKVNTPYTQLFITHIDENGVDSPPVLLSRLHRKNRAAVIPEFVNIAPDGLSEIRFSDKFSTN